MNVPMVSTMRQNYKGRALRAGDEFEVSELEAADLVAVNAARRVKRPAPVAQAVLPKAETLTREVTAAEPTDDPVSAMVDATADTPSDDAAGQTVASPGGYSKNRYDHRAMRAKR